MNPITVFLTVACLAVGAGLGASGHLYSGVAVVIVAIVIASALKMANTWQKFVILRAGKLRGVKGPGLFFIIPVIDHVVAVIDERIQTTAFSAEEALTKDTVPVNVDAIIFWFVHDAQKAALNITNYREAIDRVSQTSLREMIGSSMLSALLSERTAADELLRGEIGRKTADWGISVKSVEIPRRRHTGRLAGRHVAASPGGARKAGAGDPRLGRGGDRGQVRRSRHDLCRSSGGAAAARHEHHLRDDQGTRRHHSDPDIDGRQHESHRGAGIGRAASRAAKDQRTNGAPAG